MCLMYIPGLLNRSGLNFAHLFFKTLWDYRCESTGRLFTQSNYAYVPIRPCVSTTNSGPGRLSLCDE